MTDTEKLLVLMVLANETSLAIVRVLFSSDNDIEKNRRRSRTDTGHRLLPSEKNGGCRRCPLHPFRILYDLCA